MGHSFINLRKGLREGIDVPKENYPMRESVEHSDAVAEDPSMEEQAWNFEEFLQSGQKSVREYDIVLLDDNAENHFSRMTGEKWEEFVGSIREFGIITPLVIRAKEDRYEIIAGHNRKYGAMEAGLTKVPCILTDLDDVDASVWIGISNNQREQVSDLEWGWAYRTALETVKRQRMTSGGEKSIDVVAKKFGVNRKTAQRKIRLTYLLPELYETCAAQGTSQEAMIDLSYLTDDGQSLVLEAIKNGFSITEELAKEIRARSSEEGVTPAAISSLCKQREKSAEKPAKPKRYAVEDALFPERISRKERQDYVTRALLYVMEHGIDLMPEENHQDETVQRGVAHEA